MADKAESVLQLFGNKTHQLKLGRSFEKSSKEFYHKLQFDFKPASIDCSQDASLQVEESNKVALTLPNVEGSGSSHTLFQGSKLANPKECVLIFDHATGHFTLERLSSSITVKKQRIDGTSKAHLYARPRVPTVSATKTSSKKKDKKKSQISKEDIDKVEAALCRRSPSPVKQVPAESTESSGSSSAESSDSSESEEGHGEQMQSPPLKKQKLSSGTNVKDVDFKGSSKPQSGKHETPSASLLILDLQLSESSSDSD